MGFLSHCGGGLFIFVIIVRKDVVRNSDLHVSSFFICAATLDPRVLGKTSKS